MQKNHLHSGIRTQRAQPRSKLNKRTIHRRILQKYADFSFIRSLRDLVQERVDEYKAATAKADKSSIIASVIQTITTVNGGEFVKLDPLDPAGQKWIPADGESVGDLPRNDQEQCQAGSSQ